MKKLIITAAIVCAAAVSQAVQANWNASASYIYDGSGTETKLTSGTAYIFDAGVMSQSALYELIIGGTEVGSSTSGYMTQASITSDGKILSSAASWQNGEQGDGKTYNYYFAIVQDDMVYFSNIKGSKPNSSATPKGITFGMQYDDEDPTAMPNSNMLPTDGYVSAGRWATTSSSVPEPTSGLLMLLGVAGLALRRRRA